MNGKPGKPVNPVNGKYNIPGKDNKDLELTIDDRDLKKFIVEDLEDDMTDKTPSSTPEPVTWFACFAIYNNKDGKKDGYAKVKYSFTVDMDNIEKLYVGLGGPNGYAKDVTEEIKQNGKVTLNEGDPPVGRYP